MLTYQRANAITEPGRYRDDLGLYLNVAKGGSKSWILRIVVGGRRRDVGLGSFPRVSVADARKAAAAYRGAVSAGVDPAAERRAPAIPTFAEAADAVYDLNAPTWAPHHAKIRRQSLDRHALPRLGALRVDRITRADVLAALQPLWASAPNQARRVRQRIRAVLRWSQAYEFVEHNVAGDAIDGALPRARPPVRHHAALAYEDAPDAWQRIEPIGAAGLCLRFLILTATRSGEARGARWSEVDLDARLWVIPPSRMKARAEHRVPLSPPAVAVLEQARALDDGSGLVFPSPYRHGREIDPETLRRTLRATGLACSVHGWRSTFRDWAAENTGASWAVMEASLAHATGGLVERAYARSDLLAQRRALMQQWADYITG